jgi:hypothetical protein
MDLQLYLLLGTALVLFLGLLIYCAWSTPKCHECGAKVAFSRDTLCQECKERKRLEEIDRKRSITQAVLSRADATPATTSTTCPQCGGRRIRPAPADQQLAQEASFAFHLYQCADCQHCWAARRNKALLLVVLTVSSLIALAGLGGLCVFTVLLLKEIGRDGAGNAAAKTGYLALVYGFGLAVVAFAAWVLWYCLKALRLPTNPLPNTGLPQHAANPEQTPAKQS